MAETKTTKETVKMVTIRIPKTKTERDDVYCSVNGKPYLIQRGVDVKVPDYVAEVLEHSNRMLDIAMDYEDKKSAKVRDKELI